MSTSSRRVVGVFIGIDRYESPDIRELRFAERDAKALHALVSDTLGDGVELLLGQQATRAAVEETFSGLREAGPDDFVIVGFSGHGSETHELVTYDSDVYDLRNTSIPLDQLTEWLKRIPARQLVCVLDCCFSGAMGAKVLQVGSTPRSIRSEAALLDQLAGDGRLILTASTANQAAWENPKIRHGLLTHFLLQALQGAEEVRKAGKVSIYRMLEYVTERVIDAASNLGVRQEPTLRGTLDGNLTWPVFTPGARFAAAFPEVGHRRVDADVRSLKQYGFPNEVLQAWSETVPTLNELQQDAVNDFGVLNGEHLVVSAPTSSGKTLIGELAALRGVLDRKRALFLLPMKALVNDKFAEFTRKYGSYGLRSIRATGDISDDVPALLRGQYDLCLMTYEKFARLVMAHPHILHDVGAIVIDEVQMIVDAERGPDLELLLTLIRARRRFGADPQLIALSAVIGDSNGLERWLNARLLRRDERPVPLDEGVLRGDGSFRYLSAKENAEKTEAYVEPMWSEKNSSRDLLIPLVRKLVGEGKKALVFRNMKGSTVGCATYLSQSLGLPPATETIDALPTGDPSVSSGALRRVLEGGVAFHNADLDRDERLVLEEHFRDPEAKVRVMVATTTLAMGINTPAEAVVIVELMHPGPTPTAYSVAEYKNMIGRAGRLGHAEKGTSYVIAPTARGEYEVWQHYVLGNPEDVRSRLFEPSMDARNLVLRTLAAGSQIAGPQSAQNDGMTAAEIVAFVEDSFGAFQQRQSSSAWKWDESNLYAAVDDLARNGLVQQGGTERYTLGPLGRLAGESGTDVTSVIRLVHAARTGSPITDAFLLALAQLTTELEAVFMPFNRSSKHKEPQEWIGRLQREGVPAGVVQIDVRDLRIATARAKKAVACLLWMSGRSRREIETLLMQFDRNKEAAGAVHAVKSRTVDLLPTVVQVMEIVREVDLSKQLDDLMLRLDLGLPTSLVDVARVCRSLLTRSEYLRLGGAGIVSIDGLAAAKISDIADHLGDAKTRARAIRELARETKKQQRRTA